MIIVGGILAALGLASVIYGISLNNDMEAQLNAVFTKGTANPGTVWIVVGAVAMAIAAILIVVALMKRSGSFYKGKRTGTESFFAEERKHTVICPNCGKSVSGSSDFCSFCGGGLRSRKKVRYCPHCESALSEDDVFCPACGSSVKSRDDELKRSVEFKKTEKPEVELHDLKKGWSKLGDDDL